MKTTPNPTCPTCGLPTAKNGKTKAGKQRYRCKAGHSHTPGATPGNKPKGNKPMTATERWQKHQSSLSAEEIAKARRRKSQKQKERRAKKRKPPQG